MKNAVHACNIENEVVEIRNEHPSILYLASHTHNQSVKHVKHKLILSDDAVAATDENVKPIKSVTFAYPKQTAIKKRKTIAADASCYLNRNDQFDTVHHPDMNLIKTEPNNIFIAEIVKLPPKQKRQRKRKFGKRNSRVANLIEWTDDLCFQPDIEAKYDCNVKPNDYVQYLNDPVCDPMFCQFDATSDDDRTCRDGIVRE